MYQILPRNRLGHLACGRYCWAPVYFTRDQRDGALQGI